jgi:hypothetical protein
VAAGGVGESALGCIGTGGGDGGWADGCNWLTGAFGTNTVFMYPTSGCLHAVVYIFYLLVLHQGLQCRFMLVGDVTEF